MHTCAELQSQLDRTSAIVPVQQNQGRTDVSGPPVTKHTKQVKKQQTGWKHGWVFSAVRYKIYISLTPLSSSSSFVFLSCFQLQFVFVFFTTSGSVPGAGTVVHEQNTEAGSGPSKANIRKIKLTSNHIICVRQSDWRTQIMWLEVSLIFHWLKFDLIRFQSHYHV